MMVSFGQREIGLDLTWIQYLSKLAVVQNLAYINVFLIDCRNGTEIEILCRRNVANCVQFQIYNMAVNLSMN